MKTSSLELLEKTQLLPAQARAILEVMESELAARDSALATKADLHDGLLASRADLREGLLASRAELREGLHASRAELREGLHASRAELQEGLHALALKLETMRGELKSDIQGTVRWNFAFWVVQLAAIAGILKLLR